MSSHFLDETLKTPRIDGRNTFPQAQLLFQQSMKLNKQFVHLYSSGGKGVNPHLSLLKVSHQSINISAVTVKVSKSTQLVPGQSRDECDDCELPRRLKPIERTRYD
ncbi:hypothetical protein CDAR_173321 [Caerostris darwini]|uniref:Uncharacterized protein n=1 Tax=Caerostris darwini TaxID=1538125 RepID=A0AAV4V1P6_9ARAC|nr:hypothetical protein CDAR_173321 [Caerostris darwini]